MQRKSKIPDDSPPTPLKKKKKTYDKDLLNNSLYEVLAYYAPGEARTIGTRTTYTCPECHKPKLDASSVHMKAGCWNAECPVPKFADALGLIIHFESIDSARRFREVLKKGYEIIGMDQIEPDEKSPTFSNSLSNSSAKPPSVPEASSVMPAWRTASPSSAGKLPKKASSGEQVSEGPPPEDIQRLWASVYLRVMDYCKLEERDRDFFRGRGLTDESIDLGAFGSISFKRAQALKETLLDEFGLEDLLQVPGFSAKDTGELRFTLTGDYALIPYHDSSGRITTIEGRWTGKGPPPREMGKYVSLSGAGNHLYVFPGRLATEVEAFCEGPVGAMVAAQCGITVGAIQGFRRYRSSSGSAHDSKYGEGLLELRGVDFSGRLIPYIPDVDDPPQPEVSQTAPEAARWLVEKQGGRAALLSLPEGKDLDEWLLKHQEAGRKSRFEELLLQAAPLAPDPSEDTMNTKVVSESSNGTRDDTSSEPAGYSWREDGESGGETSSKHATASIGAVPEETTQPSAATHTASETVTGLPEQGESEDPPRIGADLYDDELRDKVYRAFLEGSPLSGGHQKVLTHWKVRKEIAVQAGFSSFLPARSERLRANLLKTFERSALERVPGFGEGSDGTLALPFAGFQEGLIVFPYKDAEGRITTLEGVRLSRGIASEERYVSLGQEEARLYLPPGVQARGVELVCGGILSALNLAEAGIQAAALRGLEASDSFTAGGAVIVREVPYLHLGGRPVGVFEDQDDSASLSAAVKNLGGYAVPVELSGQTESVERWITSLSGKDRKRLLEQLLDPVRNALVRVLQTSKPEVNQADENGQPDAPPTTTETQDSQQNSLFDVASATNGRKSVRPANPDDQDAEPTDDVQGGADTSGSPQEDVSGGQKADADEEEARRIESQPSLHGEGWLEVRFEDIPKIVARDRLRAEREDGHTGGSAEGEQTPNSAVQTSRRPSLVRSDLHLGSTVGALGLLGGALVCVAFLYALNWPLALAGSALAALCCGMAAGLLFGVASTLGVSERRSKSSANSSVYNSASDAWIRSWLQAAFAFLATYLFLTLCHHTAHLVVYPLAGGSVRGPDTGLLSSVGIFFGDVLDGIVPNSAVREAYLVALIPAIAIFVRVWEVRKKGPAETVVEVAGGSYTLPATRFMTFWEGVAAAMVFAVVGRASYFLLMAFAGSFEDGVGSGVVQTLVDGKLTLVSCLLGLGVAVYGWLGSNSRRRVVREHLLGTLKEH